MILFYGQYPILRCRAYLYCHLCIVAMWIEWLIVVKCQHDKIPSYFISRTFRVDEKMPALYSTDALSWIVIVTAQWKCSKRELDQFCIQTNSEYAWFHLSCFHRRRRNVEKLTKKMLIRVQCTSGAKIYFFNIHSASQRPRRPYWLIDRYYN